MALGVGGVGVCRRGVGGVVWAGGGGSYLFSVSRFAALSLGVRRCGVVVWCGAVPLFLWAVAACLFCRWCIVSVFVSVFVSSTYLVSYLYSYLVSYLVSYLFPPLSASLTPLLSISMTIKNGI